MTAQDSHENAVKQHEVVVVGGGAAGSSAALMLGRCRRDVLVVDAGEPRNGAARALHAYPTRDGVSPSEWLVSVHAELRAYPTVARIHDEVIDVRRDGMAFELDARMHGKIRARRLLLATGVRDELPAIDGIRDLYGQSVFHCPYCDGFEVADRALAAYGRNGAAFGLALELTAWSRDVVVLTDGTDSLSIRQSRALAREGIAVRGTRILRLEGRAGRLESVVFADGQNLPRDALFFATGQHARSDLALRLGCRFDRRGVIRTSSREATNVRGLYVAGDASGGEQLVLVAASEGARAAIAIHRELADEDRRARTRSPGSMAFRTKPSVEPDR